MRDSVPSARYSSYCNVLRQWSISLIPTYRESTDSMSGGGGRPHSTSNMCTSYMSVHTHAPST